jgi:hypothetical protein
MVRSYVEKVKRSFSIFDLIYPHSSLVECWSWIDENDVLDELPH